MLTWLSQNLGTIVVLLIVASILTGIIIKMVKDKRKGNSSCGCGCSSCAMRDKCHK